MTEKQQNGLEYLLILNSYNEPLLFKSYKTSSDDLNIQLHCYASLDYLDEKLISKGSEYLGNIYTIYNLNGEYSVYAFYTATKIKVLAVFKMRGEKTDEDKVKQYFVQIYRLYRKELYQPFENTIVENKFSKKFHMSVDLLSQTTGFK